MDDLISRQAAIDELKKYIAVNRNPNHDARIWEEGMNCAVTVIGALPSAQPERKKGKWIRNINGTYSCNLCHSWIPNEQLYYANHCLFCGADMREEKTDD